MPSVMVLFLFLSVSVVAVFSMIAVASWAGARQKEREAFYNADVIKKLAETQGAGAGSALELFREQQRYADIRKREGLRIGGAVNVALGIALIAFLHALLPGTAIFLCGLIPFFIGIALAASSFMLVRKK